VERDDADVLAAQGTVNQLKVGGGDLAVADRKCEPLVAEKALRFGDVPGNEIYDIAPGSLFAGYVDDGQTAPANDADAHRFGQSLARTNICSKQPVFRCRALRRGARACERINRMPVPPQIVATFTINQKPGTWNRADWRRVV